MIFIGLPGIHVALWDLLRNGKGTISPCTPCPDPVSQIPGHVRESMAAAIFVSVDDHYGESSVKKMQNTVANEAWASYRQQ